MKKYYVNDCEPTSEQLVFLKGFASLEEAKSELRKTIEESARLKVSLAAKGKTRDYLELPNFGWAIYEVECQPRDECGGW